MQVGKKLKISVKHNTEVMPEGYIDKYCKRCYYYLNRIDYATILDGIWNKDLCYYYCWRRNTKGKVVDESDAL